MAREITFTLTAPSVLFLVLLAALPFVLAGGGSASDEVRLSDVSVLLPFSDKASHTLEAFNGCFDWCVQPFPWTFHRCIL